jgi:hypothetical protein
MARISYFIVLFQPLGCISYAIDHPQFKIV